MKKLLLAAAVTLSGCAVGPPPQEAPQPSEGPCAADVASMAGEPAVVLADWERRTLDAPTWFPAHSCGTPESDEGSPEIHQP